MAFRFFSRNIPTLLGASAAAATVGAGAWMYDHQRQQQTFTSRDGITVVKGRLTQRERFDQFAGSLSSSSAAESSDASASSSASSSSSSFPKRKGEKHMTLDEFILSFLPDGATLSSTSSEALSSSSSTRQTKGKSAAKRFASLERVFHQLDADGDGVLSFAEYCTLFSIIAADDDLLKTAFIMFDENDNNALDAGEFSLVLKALNPDPTAELLHVSSFSTSSSSPTSSASPSSSTLFHAFFGPQLDRSLSFADFDKTLRQLRGALREAVFDAVDADGRGRLDATQLRQLMFGHRQQSADQSSTASSDAAGAPSLESSSSGGNNPARDALRPFYREGDEHLTADKATYAKFCEIIRCSHAIKGAMAQFVANKARLAEAEGEGEGEKNNSNGEDANGGDDDDGDESAGLNKDEFLRAVAVGVRGRVQLSPRETELFFALFDGNSNGIIEPDEFEALCQMSKAMGAGYHRDFSRPKLSRTQQFQLCVMQRDA